MVPFVFKYGKTMAFDFSLRKQTSSKLGQISLGDFQVPYFPNADFLGIIIDSKLIMTIFIWFIKILIKLFSF